MKELQKFMKKEIDVKVIETNAYDTVDEVESEAETPELVDVDSETELPITETETIPTEIAVIESVKRTKKERKAERDAKEALLPPAEKIIVDGDGLDEASNLKLETIINSITKQALPRSGSKLVSTLNYIE